jgi:hypothetical protein
MTRTAVSSPGLRPATEPSSTLETDTGLSKAANARADARNGGALAYRGQLDGAGHDGLELLVGLALPLQPLRADHEHVEAPLALRQPRRVALGTGSKVSVPSMSAWRVVVRQARRA